MIILTLVDFEYWAATWSSWNKEAIHWFWKRSSYRESDTSLGHPGWSWANIITNLMLRYWTIVLMLFVSSPLSQGWSQRWGWDQSNWRVKQITWLEAKQVKTLRLIALKASSANKTWRSTINYRGHFCPSGASAASAALAAAPMTLWWCIPSGHYVYHGGGSLGLLWTGFLLLLTVTEVGEKKCIPR